MGTGHKLGQPVEDGSGLRVARRWRLLLAHDATSSTCDPLLDAIEGALGNVDISESSSIDDARVALRRWGRERRQASMGTAPVNPWAPGSSGAAHAVPFDLVLVCLDLPPAPLGGVRLTQEILEQGLPVILVTRSLRWIPPGAAALRELPWITPDAEVTDVARAVGEVVAAFGSTFGLGSRLDGGSPPNVRPEGTEILPERARHAGT